MARQPVDVPIYELAIASCESDSNGSGSMGLHLREKCVDWVRNKPVEENEKWNSYPM